MRNLDRLLSILEERHQEPQRVKHLTLILHLVQVRTGYTCRSWQVYLTCSETAPVMESRVNNCPFWLEKNPFLNKNSLLQFKLIIFVISDNNVVIWLAPMYFMVAFQLSLSSSSSSTDSALSVNPQKPCFLYSWCFLSLSSEFSPHSHSQLPSSGRVSKIGLTMAKKSRTTSQNMMFVFFTIAWCFWPCPACGPI